MGVQVVHHQRNPFRIPIAFGNIPEKPGPIRFGLVPRHLGHPRSGQRLARHEYYIADAASLALVILPGREAGASRDRCARLADELRGVSPMQTTGMSAL